MARARDQAHPAFPPNRCLRIHSTARLGHDSPVGLRTSDCSRLRPALGQRTLQVQVDLRSSVKLLDVAVVAQRAGVPASTLRFYEEKGLIASAGRRGMRRLFDSRVLERL